MRSRRLYQSKKDLNELKQNVEAYISISQKGTSKNGWKKRTNEDVTRAKDRVDHLERELEKEKEKRLILENNLRKKFFIFSYIAEKEGEKNPQSIKDKVAETLHNKMQLHSIFIENVPKWAGSQNRNSPHQPMPLKSHLIDPF